jgi:hypothetical protein
MIEDVILKLDDKDKIGQIQLFRIIKKNPELGG